MKKKTTPLAKLRKEVQKIAPNLEPDDDAFRAAVVMFAALEHGADEDKLIAFTGEPEDFVNELGRRLRQGKIWDGKKTRADWFKENGTISFWLDVCTGLGFLNRTRQRKVVSHKIGARA